MTLKQWISDSGGRVVVAQKLHVTPQAIHYWFSRSSMPRYETMLRIVILSNGKVGLAQILNETAPKKKGGRRAHT